MLIHFRGSGGGGGGQKVGVGAGVNQMYFFVHSQIGL